MEGFCYHFWKYCFSDQKLLCCFYGCFILPFHKSFYISKSRVLQNARELELERWAICWRKGASASDDRPGVCTALKNFQMHEVTLILVSPAAFKTQQKLGYEWVQ